MSATRIGVVGAGGRMGRMLIEATLKNEQLTLGAAFDVPGSPAIGKTAGDLVGMPCDVVVTDDVAAGLKNIDCLIDFTRPQGTLVHLELCRQAGVAMVIGTTGFEADGKAVIAAAAKDIPVVFAPNMAVGVNLVFKLLDTAARILNQGYDIEIVEAHHRLKIDAPSGTALRMGEVVANALGRDLEECAVYGRRCNGHGRPRRTPANGRPGTDGRAPIFFNSFVDTVETGNYSYRVVGWSGREPERPAQWKPTAR